MTAAALREALIRNGLPASAVAVVDGEVHVDQTGVASASADGKVIIHGRGGWSDIVYASVDGGAAVLTVAYYVASVVGDGPSHHQLTGKRALQWVARVDRALAAHPDWTRYQAWQAVWEQGWRRDPAPTAAAVAAWAVQAQADLRAQPAGTAADLAHLEGDGPQARVTLDTPGKLDVHAKVPPDPGSWQPGVRWTPSLGRAVDYEQLLAAAQAAYSTAKSSQAARAAVVDAFGAQADQVRRSALAAVTARWVAREQWTAAQCAQHCGITESTWRAYVAEHRAPRPAGYGPGGRRLWDAESVRTWHAQRPGPGARTDLRPGPTQSA